MSLNLDTSKCPAGPLTPDTPDNEYRWMEAIVWTMMSVDLTRVELPEFLWRIRFLERIGFGITMDVMPVEMIKRWEGLTVNVAPKSRAAFMNRWRTEVARDVDLLVKEQLR
jgi:hypothetical protein